MQKNYNITFITKINLIRYEFVKIGMEAMDQLLRNCQSQHLNLYVESYLKTVQKLLECTEPDMQVKTGII